MTLLTANTTNTANAEATTPRQRLATWLAIGLTVVALTGGLLLRTNIESGSILLTDNRVGVALRYPSNWLLERGESGGELIMRAEDPAALPFKTTLSLSVLTTGPDASVNDVTDLLTIRRAGQLPSYTTLDVTPTTLSGRPATRLDYAYATTETNPALRTLPVIVLGTDIIVTLRGQTYVVTYLTEARSAERNQRYFDLFVRRLELRS